MAYRLNTYDRGLWKTVDWRLVFCYLALVLIGVVSIYASEHSSDPSAVFNFASRSGRQLIWVFVVFVFNLLILFVIPPKLYETSAPASYALMMVLLVAVIFLSRDIKGSHSWFEFGPIRFQPAEFSKITTSLMLALVLSRQGFRVDSRRGLAIIAAVIGVPMLAILGENETGSVLVYLGYLFALYREGLSGWWIFALGICILLFILTLTLGWYVSLLVLVVTCVLGAVLLLKRKHRVLPSYRKRVLGWTAAGALAGILLIFATNIIFENVLQEHQRSRIEVLLGMKEDPSGVGYNVRQSMIAIGSGGLRGKGFLNGTQTTFGFVPEQSTDFIFCTIGEEWGFVGCLVVILLYVFMIYRIVQNADKSRESFTRIYGYCVAACLFMHLFINVGMTIGLMPVIGIPLPLISYGGSSLLAFSSLIFIFVALDRQEKKYF